MPRTLSPLQQLEELSLISTVALLLMSVDDVNDIINLICTGWFTISSYTAYVFLVHFMYDLV
jgi:hypothetical protein